MKKTVFLWGLFLLATLLRAQAPDGYYRQAAGTKGAGLKSALCTIIHDHTALSYNALWDAFKTTDRRDDGKVWDMYSATTSYTFGDKQGVNYKKEGDSYNREHSFPKSWFDDASPMYTDLFHLYPTDGYVNGRRSNYPFGETDHPTYTSNEGFSKLGPSSFPGYSGVVFEPADEYKGDFARTYFYMATCYENQIASWSSPMLAGNKYPAFTAWAVNLLLKWAEQDPVSDKETRRNEEVYKLQHNRNPFIDFPGLEAYVWGDKAGVLFDPDNYESGDTPDVPGTAPAAPVFSPGSGTVEAGTSVSISSSTEGAEIYYAVNGGTELHAPSPVGLVINESTSITARAELDGAFSQDVTASYAVSGDTPEPAEGTFVCVVSTADLVVGKQYLVVCESKNTALGAQGNNIREAADVTISNRSIETETGGEDQPCALTLGGSASGYTLYDASSATYLALTSSDNRFHATAAPDGDESLWTISISEGEARICNKAHDDRSIRYNASSPRFACYKDSSKQTAVSLYVHRDTLTGIQGIQADASGRISVYTLQGRLVRKDVPASRALDGLPSGLYVAGGVKVLVR